MGKIICIDAGHGGTDSGAVNGIRYEKSDNYRLALAVADKLKTQGQSVVLTRATDAPVSLAERTRIANASAADLFVSLHRNSFTDSSAKGVEIWVYTTPTAAELGAACDVLEQLAAVGVQSNRGVKKGNYHVCRETKMPAMLIELGFISNAKDNELFDVNFDAYATAITKGILEALGEPYIEPGTQKETPTKGPYRLCSGSLPTLEAAREGVKALEAKGVPTWIIMPDMAKEAE